MQDLSSYALSLLRDGDLCIALYRGSGAAGLSPILLVAAESSSRACLRRLEHEYEIATQLDAAGAATPVALTRHEGRTVLLLEDPGGDPLDQILECNHGQPLDLTRFLRIAIPLANAVRRIHEHGLIHKDVKPANILVDEARGGVWLTGFGIASRLLRERQDPEAPEVIAGTLAYMAPEQTGRMNRSIDARSDLYSLGVTLYQMLTGQLPFTADDAMEWIHCHIARQPTSPGDRAGVCEPLSSLVMKLLTKSAEERYQTASGVEADLRRCRLEWESRGRIAPFPLGERDVSDRLLIPEKLYGREREIETLLACFDRVVAHGTPELVLVSGFSGIGKSSVVHELHKMLVQSPWALYASGKFDQYKRNIPYVTFAQAFQSLVRSVLSQGEVELGRWRDSLSEALGSNGQLIVNLVPELELIIAAQPTVPDLPPQEAKNRFQMVFRRFLRWCVRAQEHPLALFLDDLQQLDSATLDLPRTLLDHTLSVHLMLVGAYRDNEVGPSHPLSRTVEAIRATHARVNEIVLAPLEVGDVGRLIGDALHCAPEHARTLAELVEEKTDGNPFFAIQFLIALADEGLLALNCVEAVWEWDTKRIRAKNYTDNIVDLMVRRLKRLSITTQDALKNLACLGNMAEIGMLGIVYEQNEQRNRWM